MITVILLTNSSPVTYIAKFNYLQILPPLSLLPNSITPNILSIIRHISETVGNWYYLLTGSRIRDFDWYRNWWPK